MFLSLCVWLYIKGAILHMKIEDLNLFVQVANQLSFTGAANILDLPQSTVSRKIKQMEEALEIRLFERTCREIFLTEPGRQFYEHSKKILQEFDDAKSFLRDYSSQPSGDITLYCMPYFTRLLVADFLPIFIKTFPDIRISSRSFEPALMDQIQEGDLIFYLFPPRDPNMVSRRLFSVSRRFYASPEYLSKHGNPSHPGELKNHNCLRFDNRVSPVEEWNYIEEGEIKSVPIQGSFTCDVVDATMELAMKGAGICWIPQPMANHAVREGKLVCLFDGKYSFDQPYYVVYHSKNYVPRKVKVFLDMLTQYVEQRQDLFN